MCKHFQQDTYTVTFKEDIYEIQYDDGGEIGHYGQYEGLTACQADMQEGDTCAKLYSAGDTKTVPAKDALDEIEQEFKAAGAAYCNKDCYVGCSATKNGWETDGTLYCELNSNRATC